jgi:S1-C subfamily serine protease
MLCADFVRRRWKTREVKMAEVGRAIDLPMTIDRTPIGTEQELKLIRDGKELSVPVALEKIPL